MAATSDIILARFGIRDTLQLTVEAQQVLTRYGKAYALGLGPNMRRYLKSQWVQFLDLDDRFQPGQPFTAIYVGLAQYLFGQAAEERPVVFLAQGNSLFMNAIA